MPRFVHPIRLSRLHRAVRIAVLTVMGGIVGAVSAYVRPMISGTTHYEAMIALFVVMPAICLAAVVSHRRVPFRWAMFSLHAELAWLWIAFATAWSLVFGHIWDDMVGVTLVYWLGSATIGTALLAAIQWRWRPRYGPYCPGCGYCLIGLSEKRCPECGRPFNLAELGIEEDELRIPSAG